MLGSLGITQLLIILVLAIVIIIVVIAIVLKRKINLSEKCLNMINLIKAYIFYNPIIRYVFLNSIKLNFMAFIVFRPPIGSFIDIALASVIMVLLTVVPIFFFRLLRKNRKSLTDEKLSKVFGALYQGKNITQDAQHEFTYPLIFFYRRTIFIIATIFLFDFPTLQTVINTVLSFASLVYLISDRHHYDSKQ